MTKWHPLDPADATFFSTAPHIYRFPVELDVTPDRVFASLQSDQSLAAWGRGVRSLRWLTPRPFGVGTRREVVLPLGSMAVREQFFRWDEDGATPGYSFYVTEANRPVLRRFAEDYVVEPRPGGRSLLTWRIALEPAPRYRLMLDLGRPVNVLCFGQVARSAQRYFREHPLAD